jgi:uncharacterized protein YjiS (DUF1127 family)
MALRLRPVRTHQAGHAAYSTEKRRREAAQLAALPDHVLYDTGLSCCNVPSLARQPLPDGEP